MKLLSTFLCTHIVTGVRLVSEQIKNDTLLYKHFAISEFEWRLLTCTCVTDQVVIHRNLIVIAI